MIIRLKVYLLTLSRLLRVCIFQRYMHFPHLTRVAFFQINSRVSGYSYLDYYCLTSLSRIYRNLLLCNFDETRSLPCCRRLQRLLLEQQTNCSVSTTIIRFVSSENIVFKIALLQEFQCYIIFSYVHLFRIYHTQKHFT